MPATPDNNSYGFPETMPCPACGGALEATLTVSRTSVFVNCIGECLKTFLVPMDAEGILTVCAACSKPMAAAICRTCDVVSEE